MCGFLLMPFSGLQNNVILTSQQPLGWAGLLCLFYRRHVWHRAAPARYGWHFYATCGMFAWHQALLSACLSQGETRADQKPDAETKTLDGLVYCTSGNIHASFIFMASTLYYRAWNEKAYLITLTENAEWDGLFKHEIKIMLNFNVYLLNGNLLFIVLSNGEGGSKKI